jgi:hypothetical protein
MWCNARGGMPCWSAPRKGVSADLGRPWLGQLGAAERAGPNAPEYETGSLRLDLQILAWTLARFCFRKDAAAHRGTARTARLTSRAPRRPETAPVLADSLGSA